MNFLTTEHAAVWQATSVESVNDKQEREHVLNQSSYEAIDKFIWEYFNAFLLNKYVYLSKSVLY